MSGSSDGYAATTHLRGKHHDFCFVHPAFCTAMHALMHDGQHRSASAANNEGANLGAEAMTADQRPVLVPCPKCKRMVPECASPGSCYYPPGSWVIGAGSSSSNLESSFEPTVSEERVVRNNPASAAAIIKRQQAEIKQLRQTVADKESDCARLHNALMDAKYPETKRVETGSDARDAARYRLIRDVTCVYGGDFRQFPLDRHQLADGAHISGGHRLEAAIDALMAERAAVKTSPNTSTGE